ncbi:hypothetical protein J6590_020138 [Homalodisca vitripennis]|nr:hypothetical protein J6590_020138 [Homalodisca vitripennis]
MSFMVGKAAVNYVNESLIIEKRKLLNAARIAKRSKQYMYLWIKREPVPSGEIETGLVVNYRADQGQKLHERNVICQGHVLRVKVGSYKVEQLQDLVLHFLLSVQECCYSFRSVFKSLAPIPHQWSTVLATGKIASVDSVDRTQALTCAVAGT